MKSKIYKKSSASLKLLGVLLSVAFVSGCISAKSAPTAPAEAAVVVPETVGVASGVSTPTPTPTPTPAILPTLWVVERGDNLWTIAANEEVYSVPETWPLIYKANVDQINDPDLIYPGQVFDIPRNISSSQVNAAINHARNRGAWTVGPVEASDREYLRNSG